jgi:hypothetical protein
MIEDDPDKIVRVVAHRPGRSDLSEYDRKDKSTRACHHLADDENVIFLEIEPDDASDFTGDLFITGVYVGRHQVLRGKSPAIPNAIAATLIKISELTGRLAHAYFGWTEGNPIGYLFRFMFLGEGDVAPITREVLRKRIAEPEQRPTIHVS